MVLTCTIKSCVSYGTMRDNQLSRVCGEINEHTPKVLEGNLGFQKSILEDI